MSTVAISIQGKSAVDRRWAGAEDLRRAKPGAMGWAPVRGHRSIVPVRILAIDVTVSPPRFRVKETHGGKRERRWHTRWFDTDLARLYHRLQNQGASR